MILALSLTAKSPATNIIVVRKANLFHTVANILSTIALTQLQPTTTDYGSQLNGNQFALVRIVYIDLVRHR